MVEVSTGFDFQKFVGDALATAVSQAIAACSAVTGEPDFQKAFITAVRKEGVHEGHQILDAAPYGLANEQETGADIELVWKSSESQQTTCFLQIKKAYPNVETYKYAIDKSKDKVNPQCKRDAPYFGLDYPSKDTKRYQVVDLAKLVASRTQISQNVQALQSGFQLGNVESRFNIGGYLVVNLALAKREAGLILLSDIASSLKGITVAQVRDLKHSWVEMLYNGRLPMKSLPYATPYEEKSALKGYTG